MSGFTSNLNYCLFFLWNYSCCQFGVTGVTGDFPWKNFSFSMKVIPVLVFKIFCPICAASTFLKCIARVKSVHVSCAQLMTFSHLNTYVVHGVSQYLRPLSCYVSAFSGYRKMIPDLLGVWELLHECQKITLLYITQNLSISYQRNVNKKVMGLPSHKNEK